MSKKKALVGLILGLIGISGAYADTATVELQSTTGSQSYGTVTFQDSQYGLIVKPKLHDLKPGVHGFHIHQVPNCDHEGKDALGHLDPTKKASHQGPYNALGHLGDLPALAVDVTGKAEIETLAPKLKVKDIKNHPLMIHDGGDNYSDTPDPMGGGGDRLACGIVK